MKNFKYLFIFLISFLSAGVIWSVISMIYLPKFPPVYIPRTLNNRFYNIDLLRIFSTETNRRTTHQKPSRQKAVVSLNGITLKAIYNDGKKAFIIIQDRGKSVFLDLGQKYRGYKLVKIYNMYVVFEKNSKKYILSFDKKQVSANSKNRPSSKTPGYKKEISKKTIDEYKKNISKIWNDIGIVKAREGYRITYIKKGSIFDKLGLKRGDIIIKVNGEKLTNDAEAWYLYNNIDKLDYLEIEIKRHNKTKVIDYEIN